MPENPVSQCIRDPVGDHPELINLPAGKVIMHCFVGCGQVRKNRFHLQVFAGAELLQQKGYFLFLESEPVHSGINFKVDGIFYFLVPDYRPLNWSSKRKLYISGSS